MFWNFIDCDICAVKGVFFFDDVIVAVVNFDAECGTCKRVSVKGKFRKL